MKPATTKERFEERARPPLEEPEALLWRGGFSARAMYGNWLLAGLISIALAGVCLGVLTKLPLPQRVTILLTLLAPIWGFLGLVVCYRKFGERYELTTQRLLHKQGILVRRTDRIELLDVDDVTFVQGIVERLFDVGTIQLASSDHTHPELTLSGIANVEKVYNLIDDARRRERRRLGVHIETI